MVSVKESATESATRTSASGVWVKRALYSVLMLVVALCWMAACTLRAAPVALHDAALHAGELQFVAASTIEHGVEVGGTEVGGLSGITYDSKRARFYAISDDRSQKAVARFYPVQWQPEHSAPTVQSPITLLAADGKPFPKAEDAKRPNVPVVDAEAIRYHPQRDTVFWTTEGDVRRGLAPMVVESRVDGRWLRSFTVPDWVEADVDTPMYLSSAARQNIRNNATFEGLAIAPDGKSMWVAMEGALRSDSAEPTTQRGALLRLIQFDVESGHLLKQVVYQTDALPFVPLGYASMGVTEIEFDTQGNALLLERAYMAGVGVSVRLYRVLAADLRAATDVQAVPSLKAENGAVNPLPKTLLVNMNRSGLRPLDNMEAMMYWRGADGKAPQAMVLFATDNNFNPAQLTQFSTFAWSRR